MRSILAMVFAVGLMAAAAPAQTVPDAQTLSEIEADIDVLRRQIEALRQELRIADPAATGVVNPAPLIARTDQVEEELRRLTGQVEALRFRVERIVTDGTNRIGDLEFRLTEIEGGNIAALGDTPRLGEGPVETAAATPDGPLRAPRPTPRPGDLPAVAAAPPAETPPATDGAPAAPTGNAPLALPSDQVTGLEVPTQPGPELAIGEERDFNTAVEAFRSGDFARAADLFQAFATNYPGGPLATDAAFFQGEALSAQGQWSGAARSYLDAFSAAPQGDRAPEALYRLGLSLGRLGQTSEACLTLAEVPRRFPAAPGDILTKANSERAALGCS